MISKFIQEIYIKKQIFYSFPQRKEKTCNTYPRVVMVTMVYQKEAGMLVNLLADEPFSA